MDATELRSLLDSWAVHLAAERKAPDTIRSYARGVHMFLSWCADNSRPARLDRSTVAAFTAGLLAAGLEASTVRSRQLAVRRFSAWLTQEGELERDDLRDLRPPKLDTKIIEPLSEDELRALIETCRGRDMWQRRDEAIIRLMAETGARAGEVVAMEVDAVDLKAGMVIVRRGKGGRGRRVPIGPLTSRAIDRYLRARRTHRLAHTPALWLGDRGKAFGYQALYRGLCRRAEQAGVAPFHPHRLRNTFATRWLAAGGSEGGLMAVAGWSRRDMIDRYTRATSEARAADEARQLRLGDF